ncbi:MAG: hydrolase [Ignavibacteriaceae bacterium]
MENELKINTDKSAIVVIDLQKGIASMPGVPHSVQEVIANTSLILTAARKNKMNVFLVRVTPSPDLKDALHPISETSFQSRGFNPEWSEYVPELNVQPSDILITKHQWGAFYGTGLDLQLRRRGIDTIILCGIATNMGVESTARFAYEFGYNQILVEDAMSARSQEEHDFPVKYIFPRLGLIRKTNEVLKALDKS